MLRFFRLAALLSGIAVLISSMFLCLIRQQKPMQRFSVQARYRNEAALVLMRLDGGDRRFLTMPKGAGNATVAVWSPDGRRYALVAPTITGSHVYLGRLDSPYLIQLDNFDAMNGYAAPPLFSPDGEWLLISSAEYGHRTLYLVSVHEPRPRLLETGAIFDDTRLFWTPDSQWIIYEVPNKSEIYRIHRSGGTPQRIADGQLYASMVLDSEWIVVRSDTLYRVKMDGSQQQKLLELPELPGYLSILNLSADQEWLFLETKTGGRQAIYRVRVDGSQQEALFHFDTPQTIEAISPNGEMLLTRQLDGLYLVSRDHLTPIPFPSEIRAGDTFFWSDDGWIYIQSESQSRLWRVREDGQQVELLNQPDFGFSLVFSPDQQALLLFQHSTNPTYHRQMALVRRDLSSDAVEPLIASDDSLFFRHWFMPPDYAFGWQPLIVFGLFLSGVSLYSMVRTYKG